MVADVPNPILGGSLEIIVERTRQVVGEGWSPEHDDEHTENELARAAIAYVMAACNPNIRCGSAPMPAQWPWSEEWFKPTPDPVGCLVKAGALIAAEIDRRRRADHRAVIGDG